MKISNILFVFLVGVVTATLAHAKTSEYDLVIERRPVNVTGKSIEKITVNGTLPAPTLRFKAGEEAVIHVTNKMDQDSSIHWHGLLVPGNMDGVDGFNGFSAIRPGETFTYRFSLHQTGTYWYHSHSVGQEQDGLYGAIIVDPAGKDPIHTDRDYILVLSDFIEEDSSTVLANLKMSSDYYANARLTLGDFFNDVHQRGFSKAWREAQNWGKMRMMRTDLADVTGYTFLINGKSPDQNWTALFQSGERIRLRFINASAMSFFDVRIPGLTLNVVQADGQNVEPLKIDEFRFAPAETYDVVVTPKEEKAYTIVAEPIDRSGFALGTLAPHEGMKGALPKQRSRSLLTMDDMIMEEMDDMVMSPEEMISGWKKTGTPSEQKRLEYSDLRYAGIQKDTRAPERTIEVRLGGNMERYIWTINGKKFSDTKPINLKYGERVRLNFTNETMMAHPMHLHGMFVQLENGQPAEKLPNKHTVIVEPGKSYSVLLTANAPGEWVFHCHLFYHMMSGMMTKVVVAKLDASDMPVEQSQSESHGEQHGHH